MYPDVAVDLNVFRSTSWSSRLTGFLADYAREKADGIIALGECMRGRLMARGIPSEKIHIAENWADGNVIRSQPPASGHCLTVLYSGNLGLPHDVDTISAAMNQLQADDRFHFLFIGAGPRRKSLEQFCKSKELSHVSFAPHRKRDQLSQSLASAHIGLVTQRTECLGSVVPSKIYGLMAAGRPVLFIGPRQATPSLIIERYQCGWQVDCGDAEGVVSLLRKLAAEPQLVRQAGFRARQAFVEHYDLPIRLSRLCDVLGVSRNPRQRERRKLRLGDGKKIPSTGGVARCNSGRGQAGASGGPSAHDPPPKASPLTPSLCKEGPNVPPDSIRPVRTLEG